MRFQGGPIPTWAQNAADVIGYTAARQIAELPAGSRGAQVVTPSPLPTVYYKLGHLTLEHPDTVGWVTLGGAGIQCRFFGNVRGADALSGPQTQLAVDTLRRVHAGKSYCNDHQVWAQPRRADALNEILCECWQMGPVYVAHKSRHRFFWARTDDMKRFLHGLAAAASERRTV